MKCQAPICISPDIGARIVLFHLVLDVSRGIVHPRKRHSVDCRIAPTPSHTRALVGCPPLLSSRISQIQFIQVDIVKRIVKVLFAPSLQELRLHLRFADVCNHDGARLEERLVADIAVEHHLRLFDFSTSFRWMWPNILMF